MEKPYEIEVHEKAHKEFLALPGHVQARFERAVDRLATDPRGTRAPLDVRKVDSSSALYRLRVGAYRALYEVDDAGRIVLVVVFDARGRGYGRMLASAQARLGKL
ncbi:MAG TPA: type II toxin-antitoxin system RelE/ParE family toxin [Candidatus Thermoplasmatota archaeon]|nr:type II toxin-antitoxin system RelE/ParE family toxin [Candidatus Thermoplasmatota archaeon]